MSSDSKNAPWQRILEGMARAVRLGQVPQGNEEFKGQLVFPGAFNPIHEGHRIMADIASQHCKRPVEFELSVTNVDKPPLSSEEVGQRIQQFGKTEVVWVTRTATFREKARQFPAATFIVGVDTLQRILDVGYYRQGEKDREKALEEICRRDCRFLVFGRVTSAGFQTAGDLSLPAGLPDRCQTISAEQFRVDISSTEIRAQNEP